MVVAVYECSESEVMIYNWETYHKARIYRAALKTLVETLSAMPIDGEKFSESAVKALGEVWAKAGAAHKERLTIPQLYKAVGHIQADLKAAIDAHGLRDKLDSVAKSAIDEFLQPAHLKDDYMERMREEERKIFPTCSRG